MAQYVIQEPNGPLAFWLSMIPFTSPVIMMIRLSFNMGNDFWQIYLSMALLILGFLVNTWIASKIYRTGILMYGKKVSYRELWKWLRYSVVGCRYWVLGIGQFII
jgi:ABC-2 type transport system permease protein